VYPTAVENLIGEVEGLTNHYELHVSRRDSMDRMLVKVEAASTGIDREALGARLGEHLLRNIGVRLEAEIVEPETLPRYELKTRRVFDTRSAEERPTVAVGKRTTRTGA
jgi:phenylacetate-CoA ligase